MINLIEVKDGSTYQVDLATGKAWVVKTRPWRASGWATNGRAEGTYLSAITSARKLKRLMRLAQGQKTVDDLLA